MLAYREVMERYGVDRPDLRNPLIFHPIEDICANLEFQVFKEPATLPKHRVVAMNVPGGAAMPRSQIDQYTRFVGQHGAKGLAYIKVNECTQDGLQSPIVRFWVSMR